MAPPSLLRVSLAALLALTAGAAACSSGSSTNQGGGGTSTGSGTGTNTGGTANCPTAPADAGTETWPACMTCMADKCQAEMAACDDGCIGIQACLDAVCFNLSATGATDEGQCQVYCQNQHAGSKQKHLDAVNCAVSTASQTGCMPPCAFYSYDWDGCHAFADSCACKAELEACNGSTDCTLYQACAGSCATNLACQTCSSTESGQKGRALSEAYWACVEKSCLLQAWIPSF